MGKKSNIAIIANGACLGNYLVPQCDFGLKHDHFMKFVTTLVAQLAGG